MSYFLGGGIVSAATIPIIPRVIKTSASVKALNLFPIVSPIIIVFPYGNG